MLEIFIGSVFLSNILFTKGLGIRIDKDNLSISRITFIVLFISSMVCYFVNKYLVKYNVLYLKNVLFIILIYIISLLVSMIYKKIFKNDNNILPMIVTNTIILGNSLLISVSSYGIYEALMYSFAVAFGYFLVMALIYYLNEELSKRKVLASFKGYPIILITLSIIYIILKRL